MQRIGSALDETHAKSIIHRDLKPANILFDGRGDAFLSDFGIAKMTEQVSELTVEGMAMGTAQYMSPEQAEGLLTLDGRSDIYALGALSFHLLTGRLPYQSKTITGLMLAHIKQPVPRILQFRPDLPAECEAIIIRSMAKHPAERYATAGAMIDDLLAVLGETSTTAGESVSPNAAPKLPPLPQNEAPTMMSSITSAAKKRGSLFGKFLGQGVDKLKETTSITLTPTSAPTPDQLGPPAPYQLTDQTAVEQPEDLPAQCEAAWEQGFQGFKNGNIQHWLESWEKFYQTEGGNGPAGNLPGIHSTQRRFTTAVTL